MKSLLFVTLFSLLVVPAMAGSISQCRSFGGLPNFDAVLNYDKFDDIGGTRTLTAIEVIFNLSVFDGHLILDNDSEVSASGSFEFGANAAISSTDVGLVDTSFQHVTGTIEAIHTDTFILAANEGDDLNDYDPSGPDGMEYAGVYETINSSGSIATGAFGGYIGTNTFNIDVAAAQQQDFGGFGGIEWAVTPVYAWGDVTLIYSYEVVPEPATMLLLGLGGLALRRRRA